MLYINHLADKRAAAWDAEEMRKRWGVVAISFLSDPNAEIKAVLFISAHER